MYGVDVNAKRANYYLPRVDDEVPTCKKRRESDSQPPCAIRILGRKYALTATSYKYLEIGINVGFMSTVEILIGDKRGNRLVIPIATWSKLMDNRADIQRFLQAGKLASPLLQIGDLVMECCRINGSKIVKFTLSSSSLYVTPATIDILFTYEYCIEHMHVWLSGNVRLVSSKFHNFVNVLREKKNITDTKSAARAICESDEFDCESLIDSELLACALKNIMYEAVNECFLSYSEK